MPRSRLLFLILNVDLKKAHAIVYAHDYLNFLKSSICSRTEELDRVSTGEIEKLRELHKGYKTPNGIIKTLCEPIEKDLELARKQILDLTKRNRILFGIISVLSALLILLIIMYFRKKKLYNT